MTAASIPPPSLSAPRELWTLVRLGAPIALAQLGFVLLGLVDTAILGGVSIDDLAAASMGRSIIFAAASFGIGVSLALEPLASQAIGANEPDRAWAAFRATLGVASLVSIPALGLAFALVAMLGPLGVEAALIPRVFWFVLGHSPGLFAFSAFLSLKSFLQAHGRTRPAVIASVVANVVNFFTCSLLVRGDAALTSVGLPAIGLPTLGALGAGIAASVANLVMAGVIFLSAAGYKPKHASPTMPLGIVFRLAVPISLQLAAEVALFAAVALLAGKLGSSIVSAHQIAMGMASFTFMAALGVGGATATRVGHAVGAGRSPLRVGLLGIGLGASAMIAGAIAFATIPELLMRIFTPDAGVIATGASLLAIAAIFQIFDGVQVVAGSALRGAGDVRFPFVATVASHWLVGLPVALLLGFTFDMGAKGLWWGLTSGLVVVSVLLGVRFVYLARRPVARI